MGLGQIDDDFDWLIGADEALRGDLRNQIFPVEVDVDEIFVSQQFRHGDGPVDRGA